MSSERKTLPAPPPNARDWLGALVVRATLRAPEGAGVAWMLDHLLQHTNLDAGARARLMQHLSSTP